MLEETSYVFFGVFCFGCRETIRVREQKGVKRKDNEGGRQ